MSLPFILQHSPLSHRRFEQLWTFVLPKVTEPTSPEQLSPPVSSSSPLQNELPIYASHPFSPSFCGSLSRLPQSLSDMAVSGVLSVQIVRLIGKVPRSILSETESPSSPHSVDLSSTITDLLRLATLQTTKMEHVLCYGLVAYCLALQHETSHLSPSTSTLSACIDAYMRHDPNGEHMDKGCLIWIAIMIANAVHLSNDNALTKTTILDQTLNRYNEARESRSLVQILKGFLWHEDLAPQWKATWENAMQRRRTTSPSSAGSSPSTSSLSTRSIPLESILHQENGK